MDTPRASVAETQFFTSDTEAEKTFCGAELAISSSDDVYDVAIVGSRSLGACTGSGSGSSGNMAAESAAAAAAAPPVVEAVEAGCRH